MKKLLIIVIEGCSLEYISLETTPNIYRIAKDGFCKCVKAAVPTIYNVNHTTILSGKFPSEHRVIGNCIYHPETGEKELLENSGHVKTETIMDFMHQKGVSTALLTVRSEVLENLGRSVDFGISVENSKDILVRYLDMPAPPPVESLQAATWVLEACYRLLKKNTLNAVYCATNDFMMRQYAPDSYESIRQMRRIDEWLGKIYDLDHDREIYITGGYGINSKPHLINLQAILNRNGFDVFCHSTYHENPADHNQLQQSGMRFLYLKDNRKQEQEELESFLEKAAYVDMVSPKEEAAKRFNLPLDMIGDYLVFAADGYAFADFDGEEHEMESFRSNGSLLERAIPLIAVNAAEVPEKYRYSRDIVKIIIETADNR
ncbi:MAG TPA: alkaline phosphatase family protein [Anaerovoracaceae bacterium]|nr:alkaline phosphatase family protein [Anaerovoracaceae bacterium]